MNLRRLNLLRKLAYVPLTMAAQDAMAQQQGGGDPNAQGGDPSMQGGDPSMQGQGGEGMPQMPEGQGGIQIVQGPNGEPIDAETGFIVIDEEQGLEQEPNTGIIFNKFTEEFFTPEGQPMDPQEAQSMIEQAMQQGGEQGGMPQEGMDPSMQGQDPSMMQGQEGGDPSMQGQGSGMMQGQEGMDPSMQGGDPSMQGQDPSMMQGGEGMPQGGSPEMDGMLGNGPMIDPNTGLPIDPNTGYYMQPGQEQGAGEEQDLSEMIPGLEQFMASTDRSIERQDKAMKRVIHDLAGTRTDMQGLRREIQKMNDNNDTLLARVDNLANLIESVIAGSQGGAYPMAE